MIEPVVLGATGWVFHVIVAGTAIGIVSRLARHRAQFEAWETMILLVPFAFWLGLSAASQTYLKRPENLLLEPVFLALVISAAAILRAPLAPFVRQDKLAFRHFLAVMFASVGIWRWVPPINWR